MQIKAQYCNIDVHDRSMWAYGQGKWNWPGLDWTVGPLDYWTIFWTIFLDHFCTDVLDLFYSGRSERLTISAKGGVRGGYISK